MSTVLAKIKDNIAVLTLNNGTTNSISPDMLRDLSAALDEAKNEAKGVVLCGGEKFFSIGLDLPTLIEYDRPEMTSFWDKFNQVILDLYTVSLPTVCALSGHAVAGGNVLALTCDYRFAGTEKAKIGLNEIQLGIPAPYLADMILRQLVNDRSATEMLYSGNFSSFSDAEKTGLIDEIHPPETVIEKARSKAAELAVAPAYAFSAIKSCRTEEIRDKYKTNIKARNETFLDCWFSDPTQTMLKEAAEKF